MSLRVCLSARVWTGSGDAGLRSVAGKNGNYAVAETTAGHSTSLRFPDTLQPETASHHHSIHPSVHVPGAFVSLIIIHS